MELLRKISFFVFVLFILLLFVWALYLPKQDVTKLIEQTIAKQKDTLDIYYKGVTLQEIVNGVKYWEIKAAESSLNKTIGIASLEKTEGTFYKNKKPALMFTAPTAIWKINEKEIILRKPVGFDSLSNKRKLSTISKEKNFFNFSSYAENKGFFFKAEELVWNIKSKAIVCKNELWIKKGNISGHAKKLKGDVGLEEIEITGDPVIYIKNHSITTIEAEKFLINGISNTVKAQTHVLIKVDKLTGTTQFLTYNQSTGIIKIKNGIVVKYENYKISADTALYNIKNEKMILSSNGILTRGSSKLSGDVIIIDMKTKKVSIQGKSRAIIPDEEIK